MAKHGQNTCPKRQVYTHASQERLALKESACRNMPTEETARVFDEMLKGSEEGKSYCLRIKMDMKSENGSMRDPVVFRCNDHRHWRTGTKYKACVVIALFSLVVLHAYHTHMLLVLYVETSTCVCCLVKAEAG